MSFFQRLQRLLDGLRSYVPFLTKPAPSAPRTTTYTTDAGLVEITSQAEDGAPDVLEAGQHQFILNHWVTLAAAAYRGFRRLGVGAVVVQERTSQAHSVDHPFAAHRIAFAPGLGAWMHEHLSGASFNWVEHELETYDVRRSVVIIFYRAGTPPRAYRVEAAFTPPQALEQAQASYN